MYGQARKAHRLTATIRRSAFHGGLISPGILDRQAHTNLDDHASWSKEELWKLSPKKTSTQEGKPEECHCSFTLASNLRAVQRWEWLPQELVSSGCLGGSVG